MARLHDRRQPPLRARLRHRAHPRRHGRRQAKRLPLAPQRRPGLPRRKQALPQPHRASLRPPVLHASPAPRSSSLRSRPRHPRRARVRDARPQHRLEACLSRPGPRALLTEVPAVYGHPQPSSIPPARRPTGLSPASSTRWPPSFPMPTSTLAATKYAAEPGPPTRTSSPSCRRRASRPRRAASLLQPARRKDSEST